MSELPPDPNGFPPINFPPAPPLESPVGSSGGWPTPASPTLAYPSELSQVPQMPTPLPNPYGQTPPPPAPPGVQWSAPGMPLPQAAQLPYGQPPYGQPGYGAPQAIPLADSGLRFAARLLDRIIMGIIGFFPGLLISGGSNFMGRNGGSGGLLAFSGATVLSGLVAGLIAIVYDGVVTAKLGGTLMKRAFGMRVVDAATGAPVNMQTALIRAAPSAVCAVVPILGGLVAFVMGIVSLIFLFSDKMRQTVSDKIAKTVVINTN
jgi:uncharacterized RDD family membrane protein YckC